MEKKVSRDNSRDNKVVVALIQKIYSLNFSEVEVEVDNQAVVVNNISSSTLDSTSRVIKMPSSSKRKICLRTLMLSNLIFSRYSSSTEERRFGSFSSTRLMNRKART
jgi:hypothetical protein